MLKKAGYPIVLIQRMGIETNSHQCGTMRFGTDPTKSVLDPFSRSHDVPNLFVVDSSFFPSSAAVNPALTIAAQALRVADHIQGRIQTATNVHPNLDPMPSTEPQLTSQNRRRPSHL
jgi:choline dehydrogenase-like flavoprotein